MKLSCCVVLLRCPGPCRRRGRRHADVWSGEKAGSPLSGRRRALFLKIEVRNFACEDAPCPPIAYSVDLRPSSL